jgi:hypothetical protein
MTRPPTSSLSVVLLPSGRRTELLDLVEEWTRAWILTPALWLSAGDIKPFVSERGSTREIGPPNITAQVIGRNGRREVDPFIELGRHELEIVRLVSVRAIEGESPYEVAQDTSLDILSDYLALSQPASTKLIRINVICAPTQVTGGSARHLLEPGWHVNVLASPEDRPTAASFDGFTRASDPMRFDGFMLAHVATSAALWPNISDGPYDEFEPQPDISTVQLQRINVRGVLSDGLVLNVGRAALDACRRGISPLTDGLVSVDVVDIEPIAEDQVHSVIDTMIEISLGIDERRLAYHPVNWGQDPVKRRIGFSQSLTEFARFSVDKIKNLPWYIADSVRLRAGSALTDKLHGQHGEAEVSAARLRSSMDLEFMREVRAIESERAALAQTMREPIPEGRMDIYGRLWEGLRKLSFAILDGSAGPAGVQMPTSDEHAGRSKVLPDANDAFPDWRADWPVPEWLKASRSLAQREPSEISWLDVDRATELLGVVDVRYQRLQKRTEDLEKRLALISAEREHLDDVLRDVDSDVLDLGEECQWLQADLQIEEESWVSMLQAVAPSPIQGEQS